MKLRIVLEAAQQLAAIERYIAADNPLAASRVLQDIRSATALLSDAPWIGHPGLAENTREWVVRGRPYLIVYEVNEDEEELIVLNVFHGAQHRPVSEED